MHKLAARKAQPTDAGNTWFITRWAQAYGYNESDTKLLIAATLAIQDTNPDQEAMDSFQQAREQHDK